jgi:hypothetical protein
MRTFFTVCLVLVFSFLFLSCSGGGIQNPIASDSLISSLPLESSNDGNYRSIFGIFNVEITPGLQTLKVTPADKALAYSYPLTQLYPDCLQITDYGWTPNFWADIKLSHPKPGSGIDAFDARVIAILPANPGVRFFYPVFNVAGNNAVLRDPDGYTGLHDGIGGAILGNVNPFKSYFEDQPYRVWSSNGVTEETQRWQMDLTGFGGSFQFYLVVDVSLNYPNPPQPVIDNTKEPVAISASIGDGLTIDGGDTSIEVSVLDWQGLDNQPVVSVEIPSLSSSVRNMSFYSLAPQTNHITYRGVIANENAAPKGDYNLLVRALDTESQKTMYKEFTAHVEGEIPDDPVDVTPSWLNIMPNDVFVDGNYAYVTLGALGLHIYDVSDPMNPVWKKSVPTPNQAISVFVSDGYAYVTSDYQNELRIIDVDPISTSHIVKELETAGVVADIFVTEGHAYIADVHGPGFQIFDVDPPENAYLVSVVYTPDFTASVRVAGGYAYVTDYNNGVHIIDINPPESAYIINSVDIYGAIDIDIAKGYAYVTDYYNNLQIIDIDPPESAHVVSSLDIPGLEWTYELHVVDGYAYVAGGDDGMQIFDVDPFETASLISLIDTPSSTKGLHIAKGYAYLANGENGFQIIKLW